MDDKKTVITRGGKRTADLEKLQANVRKRLDAIRTIENDIANHPKYKDKEKAAEAAQYLAIAKMQHTAATLELRIEEETDKTNPHLKEWDDELRITQKEIKKKLSDIEKSNKGAELTKDTKVSA